MSHYPTTPKPSQTLKLDNHEINATKVEHLHPDRTVYRFHLEPGSYRHNIPKSATSIIVKLQKEEWEEEFEDEKTAYTKLEDLQGEIIPYFYGQGYYDGLPALILSDIHGVTLNDLAHSNEEVPEDLITEYLEDAFDKLSKYKAFYRDQKLDNFILCGDQQSGYSKVMVVDLEQVEMPDQVRPWQWSINQEGARSMREEFRYKRNPRRESSPLRLWQSALDKDVP